MSIPRTTADERRMAEFRPEDWEQLAAMKREWRMSGRRLAWIEEWRFRKPLTDREIRDAVQYERARHRK